MMRVFSAAALRRAAIRSSAPLLFRDPKLASSHLTRFTTSFSFSTLRQAGILSSGSLPLTRFSSSSHYYSTSSSSNWMNMLEDLVMKVIVGDDKWVTVFFWINRDGFATKIYMRQYDDDGGKKKMDSDNFSVPMKLVAKRGDTSVECYMALSPKRFAFLNISVREGTNNEDTKRVRRFAAKVEKTLRYIADKSTAKDTDSEEIKKLDVILKKTWEHLFEKSRDTKSKTN